MSFWDMLILGVVAAYAFIILFICFLIKLVGAAIRRRSYNGYPNCVQFIGNRKTRIVHSVYDGELPDIRPDRRVFFGSLSEAREAGYRERILP